MNTFLKWLLTIYVISILAWSGMLRAEEVLLSNAAFNQVHFELILSGQVVGACGVSLKPKIIENQFTEDMPIVLVEVINQQNSECASDQTEEFFDIVLDVRSLGLKPGRSYNLAFLNTFINIPGPVYMVDVPANSVFPNYNTVRASGLLQRSNSGQWYLETAMNDLTILKTKLDLSRYLGQVVTIEGTEVLHRTGPIFHTEEHSPLRALSTLQGPTMFLFSINTVTY
jgi:hypothetical protein